MIGAQRLALVTRLAQRSKWNGLMLSEEAAGVDSAGRAWEVLLSRGSAVLNAGIFRIALPYMFRLLRDAPEQRAAEGYHFDFGGLGTLRAIGTEGLAQVLAFCDEDTLAGSVARTSRGLRYFVASKEFLLEVSCRQFDEEIHLVCSAGNEAREQLEEKLARLDLAQEIGQCRIVMRATTASSDPRMAADLVALAPVADALATSMTTRHEVAQRIQELRGVVSATREIVDGPAGGALVQLLAWALRLAPVLNSGELSAFTFESLARLEHVHSRYLSEFSGAHQLVLLYIRTGGADGLAAASRALKLAGAASSRRNMHGQALQLAARFRSALAATATPQGAPPSTASRVHLALTMMQPQVLRMERLLGRAREAEAELLEYLQLSGANARDLDGLADFVAKCAQIAAPSAPVPLDAIYEQLARAMDLEDKAVQEREAEVARKKAEKTQARRREANPELQARFVAARQHLRGRLERHGSQPPPSAAVVPAAAPTADEPPEAQPLRTKTWTAVGIEPREGTVWERVRGATAEHTALPGDEVERQRKIFSVGVTISWTKTVQRNRRRQHFTLEHFSVPSRTHLAPAAAPAAPEPARVERVYSREQLLGIVSRGETAKHGLQRAHLEAHLLLDEFERAFGLSPSAFAALPRWRQANLKKEAGLF